MRRRYPDLRHSQINTGNRPPIDTQMKQCVDEQPASVMEIQLLLSTQDVPPEKDEAAPPNALAVGGSSFRNQKSSSSLRHKNITGRPLSLSPIGKHLKPHCAQLLVIFQHIAHFFSPRALLLFLLLPVHFGQFHLVRPWRSVRILLVFYPKPNAPL